MTLEEERQAISNNHAFRSSNLLGSMTGAQRGRYIGQLTDYTVYIAEVIDILLALELALDETQTYLDLLIIIFTNN